MIPRYSQREDELLPEELDYIQSLSEPAQAAPMPEPPPAPESEIVDPWAADVPTLPDTVISASDVAQAFPMDEGNYGRQTVQQLASPEAPAYLPPAPPKPRDGKAAFSETDQQNELFGVQAPVRDVESEMAQLGKLRATPQQGPKSNANEQAFDRDYADSDSKAQLAYVLNWMAGGPEQAQRFQESYERRKAQHREGRMAARDRDTAQNQANAPITDAQAQTLVRTYRVSPEAASRMTQAEYKQLEPVLKSTPYVANQSQAGDQKLSIEQMKLIVELMKSQGKDATSLTNTQVRGQNALEAAQANKKATAGGGSAGPRDVLPVLVAMENIQPEQAQAAIAKLQSGEPAADQLEAQIMNSAQLLTQMSQKEFMDARKSAAKSGVMGRANREFATEESARGKTLDADKRTKLRTVYAGEWSAYKRAANAFKTLNESGKIGLLVKVPYGGWNAWINTNLKGEEQEAARAISAFVNPEMRKQTGAAMSEFEKSLSFTQYGITDKFSPAASPAALGGWLKGAGQDLSKTRSIIGQEYGFDPLTGGSMEGAQ